MGEDNGRSTKRIKLDPTTEHPMFGARYACLTAFYNDARSYCISLFSPSMAAVNRSCATHLADRVLENLKMLIQFMNVTDPNGKAVTPLNLAEKLVSDFATNISPNRLSSHP